MGLGENEVKHFYSAAWLILAAMVFDALDGFVARLTKTASGFGVQDPRHPPRAQEVEGGREDRPAVAEVRSESDVREDAHRLRTALLLSIPRR